MSKRQHNDLFLQNDFLSIHHRMYMYIMHIIIIYTILFHAFPGFLPL